MTTDFAEEIKANIERAAESLRAAKLQLDEGFFDFAASRAYYAAFYAATALLLNEGLEYGKHSGVIASVHQRFVKEGKIEKTVGRDLNWLFELRSVGDYGETRHVPEEDAAKALAAAERFCRVVWELLARSHNDAAQELLRRVLPREPVACLEPIDAQDEGEQVKKRHDVKAIAFEGERMFLSIDGNEQVFDLRTISPKLARAGAKERENFVVSPSGYGIHWPALDEDLSIDGLLGI